MTLLRVVQEQHNGVELFLWPVIGPQWHKEVVQAVPCRLGGHNYELVLKAVRFGVLEAVVLTTLQKETVLLQHRKHLAKTVTYNYLVLLLGL